MFVVSHELVLISSPHTVRHIFVLKIVASARID
jgi:hypothetical protein